MNGPINHYFILIEKSKKWQYYFGFYNLVFVFSILSIQRIDQKTHLLPSYHIVGNFWDPKYWSPEYSLKNSSDVRNWDPQKNLAILHDKIKPKYELYQIAMFFLYFVIQELKLCKIAQLLFVSVLRWFFWKNERNIKHIPGLDSL